MEINLQNIERHVWKWQLVLYSRTCWNNSHQKHKSKRIYIYKNISVLVLQVCHNKCETQQWNQCLVAANLRKLDFDSEKNAVQYLFIFFFQFKAINWLIVSRFNIVYLSSWAHKEFSFWGSSSALNKANLCWCVSLRSEITVNGLTDSQSTKSKK